VVRTDTLEITDSNGPPDLTNSEDFDYGSNQEVYGIEESDFPDVIEAEGCHQDTRDSVEIESEASAWTTLYRLLELYR
jgi:hypothetical protein